MVVVFNSQVTVCLALGLEQCCSATGDFSNGTERGGRILCSNYSCTDPNFSVVDSISICVSDDTDAITFSYGAFAPGCVVQEEILNPYFRHLFHRQVSHTIPEVPMQ